MYYMLKFNVVAPLCNGGVSSTRVVVEHYTAPMPEMSVEISQVIGWFKRDLVLSRSVVEGVDTESVIVPVWYKVPVWGHETEAQTPVKTRNLKFEAINSLSRARQERLSVSFESFPLRCSLRGDDELHQYHNAAIPLVVV